MTRSQTISKRQLKRATEAAGPSATPEDIAKHYLSPTLSKYFASVSNTTFLHKLTDVAQENADRLQTRPAAPSSADVKAMQDASVQFKRWETLSGWIAVAFMSIACAMGVKAIQAEQWWFGFLLPFLGPGVPAYLFGSSVGQSLFRTSNSFTTALKIAASTLAYERSKADYWHALPWRELELRVAALFERLGYTARATPGSNDKGVDVVAEGHDEKIVVQCKQYSKRAQRNVVSELLGVMVSEVADRAILICTGGFTRGAEQYADQNGVELWDLDDLVRVNEESVANERRTNR